MAAWMTLTYGLPGCWRLEASIWQTGRPQVRDLCSGPSSRTSLQGSGTGIDSGSKTTRLISEFTVIARRLWRWPNKETHFVNVSYFHGTFFLFFTREEYLIFFNFNWQQFFLNYSCNSLFSRLNHVTCRWALCFLSYRLFTDDEIEEIHNTTLLDVILSVTNITREQFENRTNLFFYGKSTEIGHSWTNDGLILLAWSDEN